MGLASRIDLCTEIGSGRARVGEIAGEYRLEEGAEDDLGTTVICQLGMQSLLCRSGSRSLGKRHPENEHKLEGVVESYRELAIVAGVASAERTEPVDSTNSTLEDSQEGKGYPILNRLSAWG